MGGGTKIGNKKVIWSYLYKY